MRQALFASVAGATLSATILASASMVSPASAATLDDIVARLNALEQNNQRLTKENAELRRKFSAIESGKSRPSRQVTASGVTPTSVVAEGRPGAPIASAASAPIGTPVITDRIGRAFLEKREGDKLSFITPNGEIEPYGNFDLSFDVTTKGISSKLGPDGQPPVGHVGYQPAISSNLSYVGVRGFQRLGDLPLKFVYQLETQLDVSATPGGSQSNSAQSDVVKSGLTSRNSFIGLSSVDYGIVRVGKTDAPYKQSTARLNPFSGMLGDYQVIMGNTGGDNRVEFGTRLDHAIWYESPTIYGFQLDALFSPGQNRASNSDNIAGGEPDCTGGNIPGSGGIVPSTCSDGSFSDAVSTSLTYTNGPLYAVVAYERHEKVNRQSDLYGNYATPPAAYVAADVATEDAAKVAVQYRFKTNTTVNAIFESTHRYVPDYLQFQNDRQRLATWFAIDQDLTPVDNVAFGWAHAFKSPGDTGQHNSSLVAPPLGAPGDATGGAGADNSANMFTAAYKRKVAPGLMWYSNVAATLNGASGHYDLGAGGHGVTTDCHDAFGAQGGITSNPHCYAGGTLIGFSTGLKYQF